MKKIVVLAALVLTLVGCRAPEPRPTGPTPRVATTVVPKPQIIECNKVLPCVVTKA